MYIKKRIFKVKSSIYIVLYLGRYMFIASCSFFVSTWPDFKVLHEVRLKRHLGPPTCAIWFGSAPFSIFIADQLLKAFSIFIADQLRAFHFVAWIAVILYSVSHGSINIVVNSTKGLFTPMCYISWVLADDFYKYEILYHGVSFGVKFSLALKVQGDVIMHFILYKASLWWVVGPRGEGGGGVGSGSPSYGLYGDVPLAAYGFWPLCPKLQ